MFCRNSLKLFNLISFPFSYESNVTGDSNIRFVQDKINNNLIDNFKVMMNNERIHKQSHFFWSFSL